MSFKKSFKYRILCPVLARISPRLWRKYFLASLSVRVLIRANEIQRFAEEIRLLDNSLSVSRV